MLAALGRRAIRSTEVVIVSLVDPRQGDVEDDASSRKQRSLLALAGGLLAEISLPKLLVAWMTSVLLPAVLLGLAPLVATAWFETVSVKIAGLAGIGSVITLLAVIGLGWIGWLPLWRAAEKNFWSLNALAVQPSYAFCREGLQHMAERAFSRDFEPRERARLRARCSAGSGMILCGCAGSIAVLIWPATRWTGTVTDLALLHRLIIPTLANAAVIMAGYLAVASLFWGGTDASMDQPLDLAAFDAAPFGARVWRVAHLSDIHMVGERYGFRIESGRDGPRGNDRLQRVMAYVEAIHATDPLDLVLITGDITDAGRSTEWAEFLDLAARHAGLAERMLILPGNHDVNIVDRANPARLDLPFSPGKRLRQARMLSAMVALQGDRVHVIDHASARIGKTLAETLEPHRRQIADFADTGTLRQSVGLARLWDDLFPMMLPPATQDGLGVLILNSNAETHFSFTNALGMVSIEQARRLMVAVQHFPNACWIIALHHHLMEYPRPVAAFSERVGTALVNGSWFVRKLEPLAKRSVVMHGHRHVDWLGECGAMRIISAPSPVMGARDDEPTHFHIHLMAADVRGKLHLLPSQRVDINGGGASFEA
jgi:hypothetical protein